MLDQRVVQRVGEVVWRDLRRILLRIEPRRGNGRVPDVVELALWLGAGRRGCGSWLSRGRTGSAGGGDALGCVELLYCRGRRARVLRALRRGRPAGGEHPQRHTTADYLSQEGSTTKTILRGRSTTPHLHAPPWTV